MVSIDESLCTEQQLAHPTSSDCPAFMTWCRVCFVHHFICFLKHIVPENKLYFSSRVVKAVIYISAVEIGILHQILLVSKHCTEDQVSKSCARSSADTSSSHSSRSPAACQGSESS